MRRALVAAALLLAGCLHAPPRPVGQGERIELDEVTVRLPTEPDWSVQDVQIGSERFVSLFHAGKSGADRWLEVVQSTGRPSYVTPLEGASAARLEPVGSDPAAASPRYGPLSARFAFRAEPPGGTRGVAILSTTWLFAVPRRLDRGYRVTYLERAALPGTERASTPDDAAARAEAAFDGVEIRPAGAPVPPRTPPELLVRPALRFAAGPAQLRLMGASALALDERVAFGIDLAHPARGRGVSWDLGIRFAGGTHDRSSLAAVLLEPGFALVWGPARLRLGPELGLGVLQDRATLNTRQKAVLGGAATVAVDLHRGERIDLFVDAGASVGTERFSSLGLRLGLCLR
jgi:hypothetical protein